jgi:regulator of sigma E protease
MQNIFSHPIIAMLVMLGSLILFHELGHYLVGRWCGVAIEKFAIGFGHRLAAFRRGQTDFLIGWIPLGGYVKFYGSYRNEDVPDSVEGVLFWKAPVWKRALIIVAGPLANFLLAFAIFWGMVMYGIEHPPAAVGDVIEGSRAQQAGIFPGDKFLEVEGKKVKGWADIERAFQKSPDQTLRVVIERDGSRIDREVTPEAVTGRSIFGSTSKIGRVGVALGYPSAVVTIVSQESILAKDGLKTGDRFESWIDEGGSSHKINGLHETFHLFARWSRMGLSSVQVSVQPVSVVEDDSRKLVEKVVGEARVIRLNVGQWPKINTESDRSYAMQLGAVDSHLTVGVARGQLVNTLRPGDRLVSWDGKRVQTIFNLQELMEEWRKPTVDLEIVREFKSLTLSVPLKPVEMQLPEGAVTAYVLDVGMLGQTVLPDPVVHQERNPFKAASLAIQEGYTQTSMMVTSLWMIISGAMPVKALGGPVMIAKVAGDSAKAGWMAFFASMAIISINLGLVNLFPIPVLDGGQLLLLAAEGAKGAPIEESTIENFQKIGFVIVMSLIVLALYNDLSRFWSSMIGSILN